VKLFFFGSDFLAQPEYQTIEKPEPEEVIYLRQVEAQMLAVINQYGRPGLAAPQIGIPLQMILVRLAGGAKLTLLNPVIERMYGSETEYPEGCISCPPGGNQCGVARMQIIHVSGSSLERPEEVKEWKFTSKDARVVQHEIDHLNGVFFFDRANLVEKAHVIERFNLWRRTFKQNGTQFSFRGGRNGRRSSSTQAQHSRAVAD
jgi:peptide deformylase